ncbi:hypothetical protein HUW62_26820 [Myxococcus sp. AM011]|uniref:hypothetical protein n=1 Tax=Myxococcus sp. AM011 TaxID=2745200 RepID=UPI0015963D9F|nr:hypothetical protein [Myxococcus sp. AM011]NVJ24843.1 hypothetical protein [Myxococcus sp. AM011]
MLTVAIASENDAMDAEVYRFLLARMLNVEVQRWPTQIRFDGGGFRRVHKLSETFLNAAALNNVTRALVAIDNDGGSQRCPEHEHTHAPDQHGANEDACRVCWLSQAIPAAWKGTSHRACIVVPIQTLETWLLQLRGDDFGGLSPESRYDRSQLKKQFYGRPLPPSSRCTDLALEQLKRPDALDRLRERKSFQHFASQLQGW